MQTGDRCNFVPVLESRTSRGNFGVTPTGLEPATHMSLLGHANAVAPVHRFYLLVAHRKHLHLQIFGGSCLQKVNINGKPINFKPGYLLNAKVPTPQSNYLLRWMKLRLMLTVGPAPSIDSIEHCRHVSVRRLQTLPDRNS